MAEIPGVLNTNHLLIGFAQVANLLMTQEGWAVGEWGLVVKSTDGGESWFQTNTITGEGMFGIISMI